MGSLAIGHPTDNANLYITAAPPTLCEARTEGLVRYPTTLAPTTGSVTVTAQCADNAIISRGFSLSCTCTSSGDWAGPTPQCECDTGYHAVSVNGKQICKGKPTE